MMMLRTAVVRTLIPLCVLCLWGAGCHRGGGDLPQQGVRSDIEPGVVALFGVEQITSTELDAYLLSLPPERRVPKNETTEELITERLREMALQRLFVELKDDSPLDLQEKISRQQEETRRSLATELFLNQELEQIELPTEAILRGIYDETVGDYEKSHRRLVRHIYRRATEETSLVFLVRELQSIQDRALAGESFSELAKQYSDSQSRHTSGNLGWLTEKDLLPQLAEVIFSLPFGVPSEPLVATNGVHLFLVEDEQEASVTPFDDVKAPIARDFMVRERDKAIEEAVADLPPLSDCWLADASEVESLVVGGQESKAIFRCPGYEVRGEDLSRLGRLSADGPWGRGPAAVLRMIEHRERIYNDCLTRECLETDEVRNQVSRIENQIIASLVRQHRIVSRVDRSALVAYFEAHEKRFSTRLQLQVVKLEIPRSDGLDPNDVMAVLEGFSERTDIDRSDLATLAQRYGGRTIESGWLGFSDLDAVFPGAIGPIMKLLPGEASSPLVVEDRFHLLMISDRREPQLQTFEEVRDSVVSSYISSHLQELNASLELELLEEALFQIAEDEVQSFVNDLSGEPSVPPLDEPLQGLQTSSRHLRDGVLHGADKPRER